MTDARQTAPLRAYRAFCLDAQGRAAGPTIGIDAPTDEAAIGQARGLTGRLGIELWSGGRLVVWLPPVIGAGHS